MVVLITQLAPQCTTSSSGTISKFGLWNLYTYPSPVPPNLLNSFSYYGTTRFLPPYYSDELEKKREEMAKECLKYIEVSRITLQAFYMNGFWTLAH
jgi:NDP-sugar pyrophosphorylase family protein